MKISVNTSSESRPGCAGKGFGTIFFGVFFLMGSLFTILIVGEAWKQLAPWFWSKTDCTILSSGVLHTSDPQRPYRALISFRYQADGRSRESDQLFRGDKGTSSYDRARDIAERYPEGSSFSCRVSPNHPSHAVLEGRIPWIVLVVFFPLIFVAIGGAGLWATWRGDSSNEDGGVESISQSAASGRGHKFMIGFGLLFVAVGGAAFVWITLMPSVRLATSMMWTATPCTVVDSTLRSWSTDDGTSYRADVLYEYQAGGRSWRSNRIDFFSILNSGRTRGRSILDEYPDGASATCWVDPRNPSRSVLERRLGPRHLLTLIPLLFVLAGWAVTKHGWKKMRSLQAAEQHPPEDVEAIEGSLLLEPQVGPVGKLGGSLFFALFWNGIVSVFVFQAWKGWQSGSPDWFLTIFLIPFVLVGLFAIGLVGYSLLAIANPRPRLTLTPARPRLGEELMLEWSFVGRARRLASVRIFLEGREEAIYQRGTDTITEREVFATFDLVNTENDWEIPRGTAELLIPADTMHSFQADSNKIIWEIKVEGEIENWPDVDENIPIDIRPMRIGSTQWS